MTNNNNDQSNASEKELSFKHQILHDLEEATRQRSFREESLSQSAAEANSLASTTRPTADDPSLTTMLSDLDDLFTPKTKSERQSSVSATSVASEVKEPLPDVQKRSPEATAKGETKGVGTKRSHKRPIWATQLNADQEDDYLPADVAKELIEAKNEQSIYTDPDALLSKVAKEHQEKEGQQQRFAADHQKSHHQDAPLVKGEPEELETIALAGASQAMTGKKNRRKAKQQKESLLAAEPSETVSSYGSRSSRDKKRKKNNRRAGRIATYIMIVLVILLALGGFFGYRYISSAVGAKDTSATKYISVEIPKDSGNSYIGQLLEQAGVIKSGRVFNYYTKFKNVSDLQSGYYNLQASMTMDEIIKALQEKGSDEPQAPSLGTVLVKEGDTIAQIAKAAEVNSSAGKGTSKKKSTGLKSADFLKVIQDDDFISRMKAKYPTLLANLPDKSQAIYVLEGYLFPATYDIHEDTTAESLAEQMISTMDSYLSPYYDTIAAGQYNVNEILTLASLVEKEGATDDDRKNIASVFYNRLNDNMPLQSNIAVLYALGKLGEETTLKEDATIDTKVDSPYNDYTHTGLMPGPVDSPSLSAIEAVISPASTKYLYFVADVTTGNVYFADNYDEHEKNVETYINSKLTSSSSRD